MKTKPSITPGPWSSGECNNGNTVGLPLTFQRIYIPSNDAVFVTGGNREAHAQAIAALPDLIAALRTADKLLGGLLTDNQLDFKQADGTTARQFYTTIRAALAKVGQ